MRRGRYLSTRAIQLDADTVSSATQIIFWYILSRMLSLVSVQGGDDEKRSMLIGISRIEIPNSESPRSQRSGQLNLGGTIRVKKGTYPNAAITRAEAYTQQPNQAPVISSLSKR
jgi:hypothetical protein